MTTLQTDKTSTLTDSVCVSSSVYTASEMSAAVTARHVAVLILIQISALAQMFRRMLREKNS